MITVFSGTNRPDSNTLLVATQYCSLLSAAGLENQLLDLQSLPRDFAFTDLYGNRSTPMEGILKQYIENVEKFVFVVPEYNGSFPGVMKTLIDGIHPKFFRDKKAALIGLASGHAGNLRGLEHLTGILHYLKVHVHYNKLKLSDIDNLMHNGRVVQEKALHQLTDHAAIWLKW